MDRPDIAVIGGGVVGLSIALGLLEKGRSVTVLDGPDSDLRASHGNFGLIWLQGKGARFAPYARWTMQAVRAWPEFATRLTEMTGFDLCLDQCGGYEFFLNDTALQDFSADLDRQAEILGPDFQHEVLTTDALRRRISGIGPDVAGATFCASDGHVNPLRLLRALRKAVIGLGGGLRQGTSVRNVQPLQGGGFEITRADGERIHAERVILCAGLGNTDLGRQLGFSTAVRPQRGELLITERIGQTLPFLSSTIRQVDEGGLQIGGTKADAGFDDSETTEMMAGLARHAVTVLPALAGIRVVRSWGALRVMTPDGFPVYARSRTHPGAALATCHSGVTLASVHAGALVDWLEGAAGAPDLEAFDETRFALSKSA